MTGQELLDYATRCRRLYLQPEVWSGDVRFDVIVDARHFENGELYYTATLIQSFEIVEDCRPEHKGEFDWETSNGTRVSQAKTLRSVPVRNLCQFVGYEENSQPNENNA
jgi:hypothetical protein